MAIQAARLRDQGLSAAEIAEAVRGMTNRVQTSFILDTLQFMYKGGRCTGVAALGANLLNLKPCIEVKDGSMEVGKKYRGKLGTVLEQYTEARLKDKQHIDLDQILIAQCGVDQEILGRVVKKVKECQPFEEVLVLDTGCSVSVHCGPNTLGLIYMTDQAEIS